MSAAFDDADADAGDFFVCLLLTIITTDLQVSLCAVLRLRAFWLLFLLLVAADKKMGQKIDHHHDIIINISIDINSNTSLRQLPTINKRLPIVVCIATYDVLRIDVFAACGPDVLLYINMAYQQRVYMYITYAYETLSVLVRTRYVCHVCRSLWAP